MSFGVPTLVLLNNDLWNLSVKGKIIYEKLKQIKLFLITWTIKSAFRGNI